MAAQPTLPNLNTLPPEALKALILAQHQTLTVQEGEIRAQRERLHSQDELLAGRQAEIERLQLLIAKLRRIQFGRRSEKLERQIEQLELQLDELATAQAAQPAASPTPEATTSSAPGRKSARRPLPSHLPR
jgi:transposase